MTLSVLIVDDEPDVVDLVRLNLEIEGGFEVHTASDGLEALAAARRLHPDCILLDVMLPGSDGCSIAAALGADDTTRRTAVILVTAHVSVGARVPELGDCVDDFVVKPFETEDLVRRIRTAVSHRAAVVEAIPQSRKPVPGS